MDLSRDWPTYLLAALHGIAAAIVFDTVQLLISTDRSIHLSFFTLFLTYLGLVLLSAIIRTHKNRTAWIKSILHILTSLALIPALLGGIYLGNPVVALLPVIALIAITVLGAHRPGSDRDGTTAIVTVLVLATLVSYGLSASTGLSQQLTHPGFTTPDPVPPQPELELVHAGCTNNQTGTIELIVKNVGERDISLQHVDLRTEEASTVRYVPALSRTGISLGSNLSEDITRIQGSGPLTPGSVGSYIIRLRENFSKTFYRIELEYGDDGYRVSEHCEVR